jgi:hypothetical protein
MRHHASIYFSQESDFVLKKQNYPKGFLFVPTIMTLSRSQGLRSGREGMQEVGVALAVHVLHATYRKGSNTNRDCHLTYFRVLKRIHD